LEEKWNIEGRFDFLVTEICAALLTSNDSMSFHKNSQVDSISQIL
jgi:azurin